MQNHTEGIPYFHTPIEVISFMNLDLKDLTAALSNPKKNWIRSAVFLFLFLLSINPSEAQIYFEDFGFEIGCASQGTLADGFDPGQGTWTVTELAGNGVLPNVWFISNSVLDNGLFFNCADNCLNTGEGSRTLHIGNPNPGGDQGAFFFENGAGGVSGTSVRAESPVIDCSGSFNNSVTLRFGHNSPTPADVGGIWYFNGILWELLQTLPEPGTCNGGLSLLWDELTIPLPLTANDNPNVRIGFQWDNDDAEFGAALRPSIAIDFVRLDAGVPPPSPVANFSVQGGITEFCEQTCITFVDQTTFDPASDGSITATYDWQFPGGTPSTSNLQNPTNICYNDPGTYSVTLTVTDNIGESLPFTQTNLLTVQDCGPEIVVDVDNLQPCLGEQTVTFNTDNSLGDINNATWSYTFVSDNLVEQFQLNQQNPTVALSQLGFYDITITVTDINGITETIQLFDFIEVIDCFGPEVAFSVSQQVICQGDCIQFTDESTSGTEIIEWNWTFDGGQAEGEEIPEVSTQENPKVCYNLAGSYWAVLSATDLEGPTSRPDSILITVDPCAGPPQADFAASDTVICRGDCVDFQNQSLGFQQEYLWTFPGSNTLVSTDENPSVICYEIPGEYNVTLVVTNEVDIPDDETKIAYITVENCVNPPVPRIHISQDTICAGKCVDYVNESTGLNSELFRYEWIFQGAVVGSETSTDKDPANICYNEPGSYDVSLKVVRPSIPDSATQVFSDVVTVVNTPECRPVIFPNIPDTVCAGQCAFFTADYLDADSVRWTFNGGNPETSTAFEPGLVCFDAPGEYIVIVQAYNESGESVPEVVTVVATPRPPLDAGPDLEINAGTEISLTASLAGQIPNGTFLWQPFEQVDNFRAQTVSSSPIETTDFIVYYDADSSCTAIDTVKVIVNFIPAVGVPNSFSPNGDGINDVLRVLGQGIARMEFKIFNRYGQLVFETDNQNESWDGTFKDKELNAGTFVYTLEVVFAEGQREVYTGDVTLVR
ncbi:MAG: PKD domain-containing protein [Flavobacteriales bacterium]|nr:PKD domain-containing protein [Flavobacteriales bacterium]